MFIFGPRFRFLIRSERKGDEERASEREKNTYLLISSSMMLCPNNDCGMNRHTESMEYLSILISIDWPVANILETQINFF